MSEKFSSETINLKQTNKQTKQLSLQTEELNYMSKNWIFIKKNQTILRNPKCGMNHVLPISRCLLPNLMCFAIGTKSVIWVRNEYKLGLA